ncbi:flagellar biosynthesis anti-sigma factor FlgM [Clostridium sp. UBA4548]|uniref:flagellar biosynthesis anti-sigma factor FlgM n=1 Tax=Clostridium sp. UBA4548 TaxID=1946361 RepID=UPI0025BD75B4|nr:flagellar biosynthesis anti-sigma factor FlgM [Clostridium sp. UBA4548]
MKINNTNNMNNIKYINNYKANEEKSKNTSKSQNGDKCEISSIGKVLNHFSIEENNLGIKDNKDVEIIKKQIAQGKYKVDTRALAEKLMSHMKGKI